MVSDLKAPYASKKKGLIYIKILFEILVSLKLKMPLFALKMDFINDYLKTNFLKGP